MDKMEQKLSDYIDQLNAEKKPDEDEYTTDSEELKELYQTVKLVRGLKEPTMPDVDFKNKLTHIKGAKKSKKWTLFTSVASIAAVIVMFMNIILPFNNPNIVHAMEEAFKGVKAYHGTIEVVETNAKGDSITQSKLEVWANKDGNYYIKGLRGLQKGLITINNGDKKWQIQPDKKQVHVFPAFPDPYHFVFDLDKEIKNVTNALSTKEIGEEMIANRMATVIKVTPQGGEPYKLWVDKETHLPLQKQFAMHNAIQYKITYTQIDFKDEIPSELITYKLPSGFDEVNQNSQQVVNDLNTAKEVIGFIPETPETIPSGFNQESIAVLPDKKLSKITYTSEDKRIVIMQGKTSGNFKLASTAILGKINNSVAEIQSPVYENVGIIGGGGAYAGMTNLNSIRWQQDGYEYAIIANIPLKALYSFTNSFTNGAFKTPSLTEKSNSMVEVPYDITVEENTQKSVDAGSSPWRLDPTFVAQVFVNLQISPKGITGESPTDIKDFKVVQNDGKEAIIEVSADKTSVKKVYLKRLVRQDSTGIWTVVGYEK